MPSTSPSNPKSLKSRKSTKSPKKSKSQFRAVWKVRCTLSLEDPDMPPGRLHNAIFVQMCSDGSGYIHHVTGDITSASGMYYEHKESQQPDQSETFVDKQFLGWTTEASHPDEWEAVLSQLPTPPQQKAFNVTTMRVEPFKTKQDNSYTFYTEGEERQPLWKCTEWTEWHAVPALYERGLILLAEAIDEGASSSAGAADTTTGSSGWASDNETGNSR